jgi:glyoxylase-like metal-dependent hydrolase (beta-lactamase superfamily II)
MKRGVALGVLMGVGALSMGAAAAWQAQQPAAPPRITAVDKVKDNLYVLKGGGGNTAVFIATDGVVVVDAKNPGFGQPILDEIKKLTPKPVTTLINTHTHGDHVSGNVEFPATVDVVVQANTKANMMKMPIFAQNNNRGMAKKTFKDKMTIGKGPDEIDLFYFGPGHTNGDAWVLFPALHAVHAGDMFATKGLPTIDKDNGGSVLHYGDTLSKAYRGIKNVETVINGHSATTTTWDDLKLYVEFNQDFLAWAEAELKAGKTPEQAAAEWKLPAKYVGYSATVPTLFGGLAGRLQLLADEMKKK